MPTAIVPKAPFEGWPAEVHDPVFGFAWYAEPAALVTQLTVVRGTVEMAARIHDTIDRVLAQHARRVAEQGGLLILHDFRAMKQYDTEARQLWVERMKRRAPGYSRGAVVCVGATPLLRMAVQGANLLAALHVKTSVRLVDDLGPVLREHRVEPPGSASRGGCSVK